MPVSLPVSGTRSCFGYEEAGTHGYTYSTYRGTQIHHDACFGDHVDHMITLEGQVLFKTTTTGAK